VSTIGGKSSTTRMPTGPSWCRNDTVNECRAALVPQYTGILVIGTNPSPEVTLTTTAFATRRRWGTSRAVR